MFKAFEHSLVSAIPTKNKLSSRCDIPLMPNFVFWMHCKDVEKVSNNWQDANAPIGNAAS